MRARDFFDELAEKDPEFSKERSLAATGLYLAGNLYLLRLGRGWSMENLSQRVGIKVKRLRKIEAARGSVSLRTVSKLALVFGTTPEELIAPRYEGDRLTADEATG